MTYQGELAILIREVLRAVRALKKCGALTVLEAERVLEEADDLANLRATLADSVLAPGLLAQLVLVVAKAEQALAGETRTAVISHDTGCDGETLEKVSEFTHRGHRIADSVGRLKALEKALAELHDAVTALRTARSLADGA
ncbi:hypothetical protein [Pararhodobacter sp. SW119]|uniref:hypothetical protein n=1 Tax=Pararhodobacter sp. SW119 TaxID=2780075 RepID=UPI001ADFFC65|nr:hypothetical protein [Pararhodobacter sp. SW119]